MYNLQVAKTIVVGGVGPESKWPAGVAVGSAPISLLGQSRVGNACHSCQALDGPLVTHVTVGHQLTCCCKSRLLEPVECLLPSSARHGHIKHGMLGMLFRIQFA